MKLKWSAFFLFALTSLSAIAWQRSSFSDAEIVSRAELIVVGHIEPKSLVLVPHKVKPEDGRSWEYHASLMITDILKGSATQKKIPVIIHYGLDPIAGGFVKNQYMTLDVRVPGRNYPKDVVEIFDTADFPTKISGDIGQDQIWLLRIEHASQHHFEHFYSRESEDALGIYDPEDIQPLSRKDALLAKLHDPSKT